MDKVQEHVARGELAEAILELHQMVLAAHSPWEPEPSQPVDPEAHHD